MSLHPQSPEFARLATRWLDGSATAAEAALLWENIGADAACAREFAEQARFDLLLQDTLRERQREQQIAVGARREVVRHQRKVVWRRTGDIAAIMLALGFLVWLVLPNQSDPTRPIAKARVSPQSLRPPSLPGIRPRHTTVLVARQDKTTPGGRTAEPLRRLLDDFFLTGVDLDKVPLRQALRELEDQLRELNFASSAEIAALRVQLPAGEGSQPVTFHSGSISFLKAVRALAGLAGYDVNVADASVVLVARTNGSPYRPESRSVADLLAGQGGTDDPTRNRLTELVNDARALNLQVNFAADGNATSLVATPGEAQALALLAQSRDQVRSLPALRFYVKATPAPPGSQDRILTGIEADQVRSDFLLSANPQSPPAIITVPMQESSAPGATAQPGEIYIAAGPVGTDRIYLNITPGPIDVGQPAQQTLNGAASNSQDPVIAYIKPPDVIQLNTQVPTTATGIPIIIANAGSNASEVGQVLSLSNFTFQSAAMSPAIVNNTAVGLQITIIPVRP